jgi:hypothetical protein
MIVKQSAYVVAICLVSAVAMVAKDRSDDRIKTVTSVFIAGNNEAAQGARQALANKKTCLVLAGNAGDADAVLEISTDAQTMGGRIGGLGGRAWSASGALTLRSGDLVWSRSERVSDAPFRSGGKAAGDLIVRRLGDAAGCKTRQARKD